MQAAAGPAAVATRRSQVRPLAIMPAIPIATVTRAIAVHGRMRGMWHASNEWLGPLGWS